MFFISPQRLFAQTPLPAATRQSLTRSYGTRVLRGVTGIRDKVSVRLPVFCCSAEATSGKKLIARSDIPVVFPRGDFALQLFRWAKIEAEDGGLQNFGAAFDISPVLKDPNAPEDESELWGFDAHILRDGERICHVGVYLDHETAEKAEFIGMGEDRFPVKEGRIEQVDGKALEIWKVGDDEVDMDTREVIRRFCDSLSAAITTRDCVLSACAASSKRPVDPTNFSDPTQLLCTALFVATLLCMHVQGQAPSSEEGEELAILDLIEEDLERTEASLSPVSPVTEPAEEESMPLVVAVPLVEVDPLAERDSGVGEGTQDDLDTTQPSDTDNGAQAGSFAALSVVLFSLLLV